MRFTLFLTFLVASLLQVPALVAQSDFNADGVSDFTYTKVVSGQLSWNYLNANKVVTPLAEFGTRKDIPVLARWMLPSSSQIGVVQVDKTRKELIWRILDPLGRLQLLSWGTSDDVILSGADFDASGIADAAVARLVKGKAQWRIRFDPFDASETAARMSQFTFGGEGDRVFFVNPDGVKDWVGAVRVVNRSRATMRLKEVDGEGVRSIRMGSFAADESRPRPLPIAAANGVDALVFPVLRNRVLELSVADLNGKRLARYAVSGSSQFVIGDFLADEGQEVAALKGKQLVIFNPFTGAKVSQQVVSGTIVDEITIAPAVQQTTTTTTTTGSSGILKGCEARSTSDGASGFLWKPNSDTKYYAAVVLPSSLNGTIASVSTVSTKGQVLQTLYSKGIGNGNRSNWQDRAMTGASYHAHYGSIYVMVKLSKGGCLSYLVQNPSVRTD